MVENGEEWNLSPDVLNTDLVYFCDECNVYHLSSNAVVADIAKYEIKS